MQLKLLKQEHIAIMRNPWMDWVLQGTKTIESRWTVNNKSPFETIEAGEKMYFKPTGKPVVAVSTVKAVHFFLRPRDEAALLEYLKANWSKLGFESEKAALAHPATVPEKVYVSMIEFCDLQTVDAFEINKDGFGALTGWISLASVERIRK